jgi:RimK family alpha-L-glutamate ligase
MNIILTDNINEDKESMQNIKKYILDSGKEDIFKIVNIDKSNIDLETNTIYFLDEEIDVCSIRTVWPRVNNYSEKMLTFSSFIKLNSSAKILNKGIYITNNKLLSSIYTKNAGINTIPTFSLNFININHFKKFPYIVKTTTGYSGREVAFIKNKNELIECVNQWSDKELLIQEYREYGNIDYRIIVANGNVIASFKRTAKEGEFRANTSRGGKIEPFQISKDFERMAIYTATVLGVDFVGLDFFNNGNNFEFCEANNSFKISSEEMAIRLCKEIEFISYL